MSDTFNKEEWVAKKQKERALAFEIAEKSLSKIKENSDYLKKYLDVQGRFDRYSVTNAILIMAQKPNAAKLRDYNGWRKKGVYIDRIKEKVIILEPSKEYISDDGSKAVGYNTKTLYDISDTNITESKPKEKYTMRKLISSMTDASPCEFVSSDNISVPAFYDNKNKVILVNKGLSGEQLFFNMVKEAAVSIYDTRFDTDRNKSHFYSGCTAYMICKKYGVDTKDIIVDIPNEIKQMDNKAFKKQLSIMHNVLSELNMGMYRNLEVKQKSHEER